MVERCHNPEVLLEEDVQTSVDVQTGNLAFDILNQIYILGLQPGILQRFKRDQFIGVTILINGSLVFCDLQIQIIVCYVQTCISC